MPEKRTLWTTEELTVYALIEPDEPRGNELFAIPKRERDWYHVIDRSHQLPRCDEQEDIEVGEALTLIREDGCLYVVEYLLAARDWYELWVPKGSVSHEQPKKNLFEMIGEPL